MKQRREELTFNSINEVIHFYDGDTSTVIEIETINYMYDLGNSLFFSCKLVQESEDDVITFMEIVKVTIINVFNTPDGHTYIDYNSVIFDRNWHVEQD